uniref:BZIP domain-containing protein n=1 Tax=Globisporangium ultimum (strain ATCC 200006 / CBS 805.95 / DAOM BR144) TaxID=431595 RepID=K3X9U3_GLOUD
MQSCRTVDNYKEWSPLVSPRRRCCTEGEAIKQLRRKALSRFRQIRYRKKQREHEVGLLENVNVLKSEVETLKAARHELRFRIWRNQATTKSSLPHHSSPLKVAQEYLKCFRHGFASDPPKLSTGSTEDAFEFPDSEQTRFIQDMGAKDVVHGQLRGRTSLLEQWRRYTTYFKSLMVEPHSFHIDRRAEQVTCLVRSTVRVTITSKTLDNIAPHVFLQPAIAAKLIGTPIALKMNLTLTYNSHGKISRCDTSIDFIDGLRPLLSGYKDVAWVLNAAYITPHSQIGKDMVELLPLAPLVSAPMRILTSESSHQATEMPAERRSPVAVEDIDAGFPSKDPRLELAYILTRSV